MKVVLSRAALRQLDQALDYIEERNAQGAQRVKASVWATIQRLGQFPYSGHTTNRPGFRRVVVTSYPYAIVYTVANETVTIHRIRHTSRRPI